MFFIHAHKNLCSECKCFSMSPFNCLLQSNKYIVHLTQKLCYTLVDQDLCYEMCLRIVILVHYSILSVKAIVNPGEVHLQAFKKKGKKVFFLCRLENMTQHTLLPI